MYSLNLVLTVNIEFPHNDLRSLHKRLCTGNLEKSDSASPPYQFYCVIPVLYDFTSYESMASKAALLSDRIMINRSLYSYLAIQNPPVERSVEIALILSKAIINLSEVYVIISPRRAIEVPEV